MHPTNVTCQTAMMIGEIDRNSSIDCSINERSRLRSASRIARMDLAAGMAE
jgi:hypothetical protein